MGETMTANEFDDSLVRPSRRRRRWVVAVCAASGLVLIAAAAWPIASGKTDPPVFSRKTAEAALAC